MERPSVYLLQKTQSLKDAIDFFFADKKANANANENRLVFLAQLDFWDWEMENLIFSFDTFNDRSKDWENSADPISYHLSKLNIKVKYKRIERLKIERRDGGAYSYAVSHKMAVIAPVDALNALIDRWNDLLSLCEEKMLDANVKNAVKMGANLLTDLSKYKRKHVEVKVKEKKKNKICLSCYAAIKDIYDECPYCKGTSFKEIKED